MRRFRFFAFVLSLCAFGLVPAVARAQTIIHLHADRIEFYYDRFLIEADGNVRVNLSNGITMTGQTLSMDLKLNRFLLAGHVHVTSPSGSQEGAALADFLSFDRVYFLPFVHLASISSAANSTRASGAIQDYGGAQNGLPDRWTFENDDFAHPIEGRRMPGDTFDFPDLSRTHPFLYTTSATIGPQQFARFGESSVDLLNGAGAYAPLPSFYVNFSSNPHMGANSLSGANFDATYQFAGNANSISALHLRYDTANKTYYSFEQHLSGRNAYAVFSVNPFSRPSKFWNLLAGYQPNGHFELRSFTQLHTFQLGLAMPDEAEQVTALQATQALPHSYLQALYQFVNYSLLAPNPRGYYADPARGQVLRSPSALSLDWVGGDTCITKGCAYTPLHVRFNSGIAVQHDPQGLQNFGNTVYDSIWQHWLGFTLYTPSIRLGAAGNTMKDLYVNAIFQKQRTWNSVPHYLDNANTTISLSRRFGFHVDTYLQYNVNNISDRYETGQSTVYPNTIPVVDGVAYPGFAAFQGQATLRTLSLGALYSNGGNFSFSILARKHDDFPAPIAGYFNFQVPNVLGQTAPAGSLGSPPYDISADMRLRLNSSTVLDVSRTYYFNFGNLRWSPQFVFQVTQ